MSMYCLPAFLQSQEDQQQKQKQQRRSPPDPQQLEAFWRHFVEGACLSSSHERKALALQLLLLLVPVMGPDMVPVLLSKQLLGCIATATKDKDSYLHATAKRCLVRQPLAVSCVIVCWANLFTTSTYMTGSMSICCRKGSGVLQLLHMPWPLQHHCLCFIVPVGPSQHSSRPQPSGAGRRSSSSPPAPGPSSSPAVSQACCAQQQSNQVPAIAGLGCCWCCRLCQSDLAGPCAGSTGGAGQG